MFRITLTFNNILYSAAHITELYERAVASQCQHHTEKTVAKQTEEQEQEQSFR